MWRSAVQGSGLVARRRCSLYAPSTYVSGANRVVVLPPRHVPPLLSRIWTCSGRSSLSLDLGLGKRRCLSGTSAEPTEPSAAVAAAVDRDKATTILPTEEDSTNKPKYLDYVSKNKALREWASAIHKLPHRDRTLPILKDMIKTGSTHINASLRDKYLALMFQCFKADRPDLAALLYDQLSTKLIRKLAPSQYRGLMGSFAKAGDRTKLMQVWHHLMNSGLTIDNTLFSSVMFGFSKLKDSQSVKEIWNVMQRPPHNLKPESQDYSYMILAAAVEGDIQTMEQLFEEYKQRGFAPNRTTLNPILLGYGRNGMLQKAEEVVKQYFKLKEGDESKIQMDNATYRHLISACSQVGETEKAEIYFEMLTASGLKCKRSSWNSYLLALGRAGLTDKMLHQLDKMQSQGIAPNALSYNIIIDAFGKAKALDSMVDSFLSMRRKRIRPNITTYNILIDAMAKAGKAAEAEKYYVLLKREGLQPEMRTISGLMQAYSRAKQYGKIMRLFAKMKQEGRAPDRILFIHLIDAYGHMGKPAEAEQVLIRAIKDYGISTNTNFFTSVIEAWARSQRLDKAEEWLRRMSSEYATLPDIKTYTTILSGCIYQGDVSRGRRIISLIHKNNVTHDIHAKKKIRQFWHMVKNHERKEHAPPGE